MLLVFLCPSIELLSSFLPLALPVYDVEDKQDGKQKQGAQGMQHLDHG